MKAIFNPGLLTADELREGFVVRESELDELMSIVRGGVQHALLLGLRGMGKTTLLHRLALAVQEDPELGSVWLPVLFDEEQYNLGDLADLWLNALRMVSIASGDPRWRRRADQLPEQHDGPALEEAARNELHDASVHLDRRLLLLIDNLGDVLERIGDDVQHARLREVLQHDARVLLIGASSRAIEATYAYDRPLYQQLTVLDLEPLDEEEMARLLEAMARRDGRTDLVDRLAANRGRTRRLAMLVGGNPRTAVLLYELWREGAARSSRSNLEAVLDRHTSLYKDRMERLPAQAQRVLDALAQRWEAATADEIATDLRLSRGPVSAQLARLRDKGLVEQVDIGQRGVGYQVRERFFNLWCLMRGSRRSRNRLRWLAEWLDLFYEPDELTAEARRLADELGRTAKETLPHLLEVGGLVVERVSGLAGATLAESVLRHAPPEWEPLFSLDRLLALVGDYTVPTELATRLAEAARSHRGFEDGGPELELASSVRIAMQTTSESDWKTVLDGVEGSRWRGSDVERLYRGMAWLGIGMDRLGRGVQRAAMDALMLSVQAGNEVGWPFLAPLAHVLERSNKLRTLPAPSSITDVDELAPIAIALTEAGHPSAGVLMEQVRIADPPSATVVAHYRVLAGCPSAARFALDHGVSLPWDGLLSKLHRLRGPQAVLGVAEAALDTDDPRTEHLAVWTFLAAVACGTDIPATVDDRLQAPLRPLMALFRSVQAEDDSTLETALTTASKRMEAADLKPGAPFPGAAVLLDLLAAPIEVGLVPELGSSLGLPVITAHGQGRRGDATGALATYASIADPSVHPGLSGRALLAIAQHAIDDSSRLEVAALASDLRDKAPGPWQVHAAVTAAETALGRVEPAREALKETLLRLPTGLLRLVGDAIVELCLSLARVDASAVIETLETTGYDERLLPLTDALRIHTNTPENYLLRLPPERVALAEDVLDRLT